jgi:hypothetical protein
MQSSAVPVALPASSGFVDCRRGAICQLQLPGPGKRRTLVDKRRKITGTSERISPAR